jgi:hypothetical protein
MSIEDTDLLIIGRERVVVPRFGDMGSTVEIRMDSRRLERRRVPLSSSSEEDRRRRDRRSLDVSDQLRAVGWVFITAAHRRAVPPALDAPREGTAKAPIGSRDATQDEPIIGRHLAQALLCAPCLARICILPLDRVERVLDRLQGSGNLRMLGARCEECRKTTIVYTPDRS